jgi:gamma-glutamylaminecyclotransferase
MPLVFVYGTLMRAGANHAVLERLGSAFVGAAFTRDPRTLVDLGPYPALLPESDAPSAPVHGEVWELDDSALRELDAFEGCPELYVRERIAVRMDAGDEREAFVYVFARRPPARAQILTTGRYSAAGTRLPHGASPAQIEAKNEAREVTLDKGAPNEDVAPPRRSKERGGPR